VGSEARKAFVETTVDVGPSTNTGAVKPFLSISAASSSSHDSYNGSGALSCIINDRFIIQVHEGIPTNRFLLLCECFLLHPRTEIATRVTLMKVSELRTGGGGLAEITRRRRRRSPSSQLGVVSPRSAARWLMIRVSALVYVPMRGRRPYDTNGDVGVQKDTYSRYECVKISLSHIDAWHIDAPKIRNTIARLRCSNHLAHDTW
jgi:hypothetical protein